MTAPAALTTAAPLAGKGWATLCARAALAGLAVVRSNPADGPIRVLVCERGVWREMRNIDEIESLAVWP